MQWANLSMSSGGIVANILVSEGDHVSIGQPLLYLEGGDPQNPSPQLQAAIRTAELEVENAHQALDVLYENADMVRSQALQTIGQTASQIRDLQYQIENLDTPEDQKDLTPLEAHDQARTSYERAREAFEPYKDEPQSDSARQESLDDLEQAKEDYDLAVFRLELDTALEAAQTTYETALEDSETYSNGPSQEDVSLAESRLASAESALQASLEALDNLTLLAPFPGTVSEILVRTDEWISPGIPVLIIGDLTHLQVETTDLNEIDMARIQINDPASISFDALSDVSISGKVVYIANKASSGLGVDYKAVIALDSLPDQLKWGMTAFVDITPKE